MTMLRPDVQGVQYQSLRPARLNKPTAMQYTLPAQDNDESILASSRVFGERACESVVH